jgi:hypothetical protein
MNRLDQTFGASRDFMKETLRNHEVRDLSMDYNSLKINRKLAFGRKIK